MITAVDTNILLDILVLNEQFYQDLLCINPAGNKLDIQCIITNDPDAARIRTEEAML